MIISNHRARSLPIQTNYRETLLQYLERQALFAECWAHETAHNTLPTMYDEHESFELAAPIPSGIGAVFIWC
jgi:hypothetical protein